MLSEIWHGCGWASQRFHPTSMSVASAGLSFGFSRRSCRLPTVVGLWHCFGAGCQFVSVRCRCACLVYRHLAFRRQPPRAWLHQTSLRAQPSVRLARADGAASTRRSELLSRSQDAAAPEIRECSPAGNSKVKITPCSVCPVRNTLGGKTATHAENPLSVASTNLYAVATGWPIKRSELGARGVRKTWRLAVRHGESHRCGLCPAASDAMVIRSTLALGCLS
jgi:hypothetical protein